jgi:thiol:disulfide interchange protein DsbD
MKYKFITLTLLIIGFFNLQSQILEPVKWNFSKKKISANEFELIFKATIEPRWHLYSQDIPMAPPATTFSIEKSGQYELIGGVEEVSKVIEEFDPNFDMVLKYYADEAIFKQIVRLKGSSATVKGYLDFMCCDDTKCLPPQDVDFSFDLKADSPAASATPEASSAPPAQAILNPVKWEIRQEKQTDKTIDLFFTAKIDEGFHLYSTTIPENGPLPTVFSFEKSNGFETVGPAVELSIPIEEFDKIFEMNIKYFEHEAIFKQKIKVSSEDEVIPVVGEIAYMVCNDVGCIALYEDIELEINGKLNGISEPTAENEAKIEATDIQGKKASYWGFFILSFLGGLVAILTPCVFPMIPMTVSFFMKDSADKAKGRVQAIIYGFSIIAIYTFIGSVLAVIAGPDIANWLSTHWLPNILFFLIFVIFAASFFGMFEITLPHWMVNKSDEKADKGGLLGPVFMAMTLVLVSFSCTGPIVGTILVESAGGQVLKPIIGMFGFSLAFALPFTLFAFFPTLLHGLPKSGGWLNSVKVVLGFLELALGLKFLSIADQTYHWGILDREVYLASWIVIFFLLGLYLLGKIKFAHDSEVPFISVPRLFLAITVFTFVAYLIPGMVGAPLKALSGYLPPQSTHDFDLNAVIRDNIKIYSGASSNGNTGKTKETCETPKYHDFLHLPHGLEGYFDFDQALECAKEQNKPIFIDFTGHGCVNCREMEANVWSNPQVLKILKDEYIVLALYVDDKTQLPEDEWITSIYDGKVKKSIGKKYADLQITLFGVNAQPFYVLMGQNGEVLAQPRAYDLDVDAFVNFLKTGLENFKNGKSIYKVE